MHTFDSVAAFAAAEGQELGTSDWLLVDQNRIDQFAEATEDRQWIHVDPERAARGPFGTTIAHGYLTLSLLVPLMKQTFSVHGHSMAINYGLNKVRFPAPTPSGSRVRGTTVLASVTEVAGGVQAVYTVTVASDAAEKPVCVAESVTRYYFS